MKGFIQCLIRYLENIELLLQFLSTLLTGIQEQGLSQSRLY